MKTWWIGAALAAMCVGQSAWAQSPPAGGALLPEPAPVAACPPQGPPLTPGPLSGALAPPGPGDALSLPADLATAWGKGPIPESGFYLSLGGTALQRQRPGHSAVALSETNNNADTGVQPLQKNTALALDTGDVNPNLQWGGRLTVGYLCDDAAIEVTGFFLPENTATASVTDPGRLFLFFQNPPAGFEGNNGLWLQADKANVSLRTLLGSAELNYRWWSRAQTGLEGIIGFRYVELQETAGIFADDEGVMVLDVNGNPDPTMQATYRVRVENHLLLPQAGFEWNLPLTSWLSMGVISKAGFGGDFVNRTARLTRGDGYVGLDVHDSHWTWSSLYELNAFFDLVALDKVKIRAGYNVMWLLHVDEALRQVDYNLSSQPGGHNDDGSIFYHGPMIEVQFLF